MPFPPSPARTSMRASSIMINRDSSRVLAEVGYGAVVRRYAEAMASDCLTILDLEVACVVGVDGWERRLRQKLLVDVSLNGDLSRAGVSDDLEATVDYRRLCGKIVGEMSGTRYRLVEAFAEHVACICLDAHDLVESVTVRVRKPGALAGFGSAIVAIEVTRRKRRDSSRGEV